ncbi:hypothetical protein JCM8097_007323 [Rhodosporidiobolus ruineniae]
MSTLAALPTSSTQGPGYSAQAWQYHASRLASCVSTPPPPTSSPLRRRLPTPSSSHPSPRVTVPPLGFTSTSPLTLDDLDALDPYADPAIFAALMASVRRPDEFDGDMEEWKGGGREEEGEKDGMEWEMDA